MIPAPISIKDEADGPVNEDPELALLSMDDDARETVLLGSALPVPVMEASVAAEDEAGLLEVPVLDPTAALLAAVDEG
jgi:hypothetical protein